MRVLHDSELGLSRISIIKEDISSKRYASVVNTLLLI